MRTRKVGMSRSRAKPETACFTPLKSSVPGSSARSAPCARTRSRRPASGSMATTAAPRAAAIWTPKGAHAPRAHEHGQVACGQSAPLDGRVGSGDRVGDDGEGAPGRDRFAREPGRGPRAGTRTWEAKPPCTSFPGKICRPQTWPRPARQASQVPQGRTAGTTTSRPTQEAASSPPPPRCRRSRAPAPGGRDAAWGCPRSRSRGRCGRPRSRRRAARRPLAFALAS
jgi:hypothetical protein